MYKKIGYVSIVLRDAEIKLKTCILKNATHDNLLCLTKHNLLMLDKTIEYNKNNGIHLFRISSEIVPFASHKDVVFDWVKIFKSDIKKIGKKAKKYDIRLSMHVGQYTLLTTKNPDILKRSIDDLIYHERFLSLLSCPLSCKIIIHVGGVYGNKPEAIKTFIENYKKLPLKIKKRLVIENDDKNYTVSDCLQISKIVNIPVVFDYLHWQINHTKEEQSFIELINKCSQTWKKRDGIMKVHYSQQASGKIKGSHSDTIKKEEFLNFYNTLPINVDVMLEVKDKDISAINCLSWIKEKKD